MKLKHFDILRKESRAYELCNNKLWQLFILSLFSLES